MTHQNDFLFGRVCDAVYTAAKNPKYMGNPLIEGLPGIMRKDESIRRLTYFEKFDKSMRLESDEERKHYAASCMNFFSALDVHIDMEQRISRALRLGYVERNMLDIEHRKSLKASVDSLADSLKAGGHVSQPNPNDPYDDGIPVENKTTRAHGFNVIGVSGGGKSQTIERIIRLYPQVLNHSRYKGREMIERQLVWLKLECPFDGNTTSISRAFLQAVDSILGTDYEEKYKNYKPAQLVLAIARIAANHHLGVLIIDEIQRLSLARSGGATKMLYFFTQLVNAVKVPIILIGTFKASSIFSGDFSQGRRGSGQGNFVWERMLYDEEWETLIENMWQYDVTRNPVPKSHLKKLGQVLYEETQGIIDLAIKTFVFAQELAIDIAAAEYENGAENVVERITPAIIRTVVADRFRMLAPALKALKSTEPGALDIFEDIYTEFVGKVPKASPAKNKAPEKTSMQTARAGGKNSLDVSGQNTRGFFSERISAESSNEDVSEELLDTSSDEPKKRRGRSPKPVSNGVLPDILKNEANQGDIYEAFGKSGFIAEASDPLFGSREKSV